MGKCSAKDKEDPVTGSENYGTFHITPWDISLLGKYLLGQRQIRSVSKDK